MKSRVQRWMSLAMCGLLCGGLSIAAGPNVAVRAGDGGRLGAANQPQSVGVSKVHRHAIAADIYP